MKKLLLFFLFLLTSQLSNIFGTDFGYVGYTTRNIGDDIQALAAKQFLPGEPIEIDREFIGVFRHQARIPVIVNGWFMHTKEFAWYRSDVPAPQKSWPPSQFIDPLLISIHLSEGFLPYAFSEEAVEYFRTHGPVGARDLHTLSELRARNIPSYFSGCLTLTLNNTCTSRNNIIYAVDLDDECYEYLRSKTNYPIVRITHIISQEMGLDHTQRLKYTLAILEKYKKAKAVVTGRLHATMPCLAFETPVLFLDNPSDTRFDGLRELVRHCTRKEFLHGQYNFDFNNPGENPKQYLELRKNLTETVTTWVAKHSQ